MPDENEITIDNMHYPAATHQLGRVLVANLAATGRAGFYVGKDGTIVAASSFNTYFDPSEQGDTPEGRYKKVRPIITDKKKMYAVIEDGQLWEVEFEEGE